IVNSEICTIKRQEYCTFGCSGCAYQLAAYAGIVRVYAPAKLRRAVAGIAIAFNSESAVFQYPVAVIKQITDLRSLPR
ncbi:hypothetical protein, partial [Klebsiella variicola]|uniref:hypothetical protein n=2 Tax=Klebsiella pneumoniae complex TaxID=3390273 RepID=UPI001C655ED5